MSRKWCSSPLAVGTSSFSLPGGSMASEENYTRRPPTCLYTRPEHCASLKRDNLHPGATTTRATRSNRQLTRVTTSGEQGNGWGLERLNVCC